MIQIRRERTSSPASKPLPDALGFGRYFTDHMFLADHEASRGWTSPRIVPLRGGGVDIGSGAVQYGLSIFEGLKAHRGPGGALRLFRPEAHAGRFVQSAARLCMPKVPPELLIEAMQGLVQEDSDWYPDAPGGSLYLRPTLFGDEAFLGVRPALRHTLSVLLSPVMGYFSSGAKPLRLWAEREHVRASPGGVGAVKTGGNYASSLFASRRAQERGFDQVLWLDARDHRYLEEAGTMNVFVRLGDRVITPPLDGTILAGVTRDSCLTLLREWGVPVEERRVSLDDLLRADAEGALLELWGTGTAAVVSPIAELSWEEATLRPRGGDIAGRLRGALEDLFSGKVADTRGWLLPVGATPHPALGASGPPRSPSGACGPRGRGRVPGLAEAETRTRGLQGLRSADVEPSRAAAPPRSAPRGGERRASERRAGFRRPDALGTVAPA